MYAASYAQVLQIIDVSDPDNLTFVGSYIPQDSSTKDVYVQGTLAFLTDRNNGLLIVDVSNPANPNLMGGYGPLQWPYKVQVLGNLAYVGGGDGC